MTSDDLIPLSQVENQFFDAAFWMLVLCCVRMIIYMKVRIDPAPLGISELPSQLRNCIAAARAPPPNESPKFSL